MIPGSVRLVLCLLAVFVTARPAAAQGDPLLVSRVDAWFAEAQRLAPGEWGIAIADQKGNLLWSHNPTSPMIPASTVKLLTTGFARTVLGGEATVPTRVVATGRLHPTQRRVDRVVVARDERRPDARASARHRSDVPRARRAAQGEGHPAACAARSTLASQQGPADATYPAVWSSRHRGR